MRIMFVLPALTQRLLNKNKEENFTYISIGVFDAGKNIEITSLTILARRI